MSDPADRNSDKMKQEITRLQEILNALDFKRKVHICITLMRSVRQTYQIIININ